jgi:hypothetical protein
MKQARLPLELWDIGRATTSSFGRTPEDACRWVLFSVFMKFQRKAAISRWGAVSAIQTGYGNLPFSGDRQKCLCGVGATRVSTEVRAVFTDGSKSDAKK